MNPYKGLERRSYWRTALKDWSAADFGAIYRPKFKIDKDTRIATAGSCFAQHIARQLRERGFNYMDFEPAPLELPQDRRAAFGYGLFSARYGNIYTTRQLLTLIQHAFGARKSQEVWVDDGRFYDPLRPTVEPGGFGDSLELFCCREGHHAAVRRMAKEIEVFVFTFGLTEAWVNRRTGDGYQICPGTTVGVFDPAEHVFLNMGHNDVVTDMEAIFKWWRKLNPSIKFLLTVSPVPLAATATDAHAVPATLYSKSVLRSAAGYLASRHAFVDYFPSYEIITSTIVPRDNYEDDRRNVRLSSVSAVMDCFFLSHGFELPGAAPRESEPAMAAERRRAEVIAEMSVLCDEAALDMSERA